MMKTSTLCLLTGLFIYTVVSKLLFDKVYLTSKVVVDEEFHIPLGLAYCRYDFSVWDSKVTTLPGLYMISTLIIGPLNFCTTYWLRFVSLLASILNIFLLLILFTRYEKNEYNNILSAFTLVLLPPMYFFSHLYYTDIVSLSVILIMFVLNELGYNYFASIFGMVSILCRQTNAIWVGMILGKYVLVEMYCRTMNRRYNSDIPKGFEIRNMVKFGIALRRQPLKMLLNMPLIFWIDSLAYVGVLITFFYFIYLNGGVVVGDKTAHEVTLHVPQLFYFSLFCLIFGWPIFVREIMNFLRFGRKHKGVMFVLLVAGFLIVHYNTLIHPYILADNRHYIFYIWNRFYGKYFLFRYVMVPVYIFAWYVIIKILYHKHDVSWLIMYIPCIVAFLITQKLIDVRYYFIPYILLRLRVRQTSVTPFNLILELVTYIIINCITFNLFLTKAISWSDYELPQRLIW